MPKLLLILLQRPSIFTSSQLNKLADVFINIGTLFFGSAVVPFFIRGLDRPGFDVLVIGLIFSAGFWLGALLSVGRRL